MDQRTTGIYLSRILSGFLIFLYKGCKYKLVYPDINIKYEAEMYAQQIYEENKFNDWIQDEDIVNTLVGLGLWNYQGDNQLNSLEKQIEDLKVDLYKNFLNPNKLKQTRRTLSSTKRHYAKMYDIRHSLDSLTTEGFAQGLKNQYILVHSLYDHNNQIVFNCLENANYNSLIQISNAISSYTIDMSEYRTIARSETWKNYWSANSDFLFDKPTTHWTDEQKTLVIMTKMYDSAYSHPECPSDDIINDDDMFDGWLIHQKRESDKNKNKSRTEKLLVGKGLDKANEVFVMAHSQEEAKHIYDLNDNNSRHIIKERSAIISKTGTTQDSSFPDVQRDLVIKSNENFKNNFRK